MATSYEPIAPGENPVDRVYADLHRTLVQGEFYERVALHLPAEVARAITAMRYDPSVVSITLPTDVYILGGGGHEEVACAAGIPVE